MTQVFYNKINAVFKSLADDGPRSMKQMLSYDFLHHHFCIRFILSVLDYICTSHNYQDEFHAVSDSLYPML